MLGNLHQGLRMLNAMRGAVRFLSEVRAGSPLYWITVVAAVAIGSVLAVFL